MLSAVFMSLSLAAIMLASTKWLDPKGVEFPYLEGNSLTGEEIPFPYHKKGEIRILTLTLSKRARKEAREWTTHVLDTFSQNPEIHYFEVPLQGRFLAPVSEWRDRQLKSASPAELHARIVPVYEAQGTIRRKLGIRDRKSCYLYVVDRKGIVRHWEKGASTPEKQQKLLAEIHRLYQSR